MRQPRKAGPGEDHGCPARGRQEGRRGARKADELKRNAQADANEKINDAKSSFAKTREEFRHDVQAKLDKLDKKLGELDTKAMKETGKAKTDLDASVSDLKARRAALGTDMKRIDDTVAADWDALKSRIEKSVDDLESAVDKLSERRLESPRSRSQRYFAVRGGPSKFANAVRRNARGQPSRRSLGWLACRSGYASTTESSALSSV
ncbi:MAG: hypothetical protein U0414_06465 [Polyangiaceae bacterium]